MAQTTWTAFDYIDGLKAALDAREGLAGVNISSGPIPADQIRDSAIAIIGVGPGSEEPFSIGPREGPRTNEEQYSVAGGIVAHSRGKGETVVKAARDRVAALFAEVEQAVRANFHMGVNEGVGGNNPIVSAYVARKELDQGVTPDYRWASVVFEIDVTARIGGA